MDSKGLMRFEGQILIHSRRTRLADPNHRRLSTIAKPDSESHCKPWWEDLWRIRNGCTGSCSRKWYSSLHDFCIATHLTCVRSYISPTLVWQLWSANRSTFLSLSGHLARICTVVNLNLSIGKYLVGLGLRRVTISNSHFSDSSESELWKYPFQIIVKCSNVRIGCNKLFTCQIMSGWPWIIFQLAKSRIDAIQPDWHSRQCPNHSK